MTSHWGGDTEELSPGSPRKIPFPSYIMSVAIRKYQSYPGEETGRKDKSVPTLPLALFLSLKGNKKLCLMTKAQNILII